MADLQADLYVQRKVPYEAIIPVAANTVIYAGALVGLAAGYASPCGDDASGIFMGVAIEAVDNNPGNAGAQSIKVAREGKHRLKATGLTQADVGKLVYAVDDNSVALVATTTNDVCVGQLVEIDVESGYVWVDIARRTA